jgi:hypothetical protein
LPGTLQVPGKYLQVKARLVAASKKWLFFITGNAAPWW